MKKILSLISLSIVLVLGGAALSGCSLGKKSASPTVTAPEAGVEIDQTVGTSATEQANEEPIIDGTVGQAEVTDGSLGVEIDNLDSEFNNLKTTGFEAGSLSDTDLGM